MHSHSATLSKFFSHCHLRRRIGGQPCPNAGFLFILCRSVRHRVRVCFRPHYHNQRFPSVGRSMGRLVGHRSAASRSLFRAPPSILHPEEVERRTNGHRTFIAHSLVRPRPFARPSVRLASSHHLARRSFAPSIAAATTTPRPRSPFLIVSTDAGLYRRLPERFLGGFAQNRGGSLLTRLFM